MPRIRRHLFALAVMVAGSGSVFGMMYVMNASSAAPPAAEARDEVAFNVDKKPPPPKPQREKVERKRPDATPQRSAPTPSLTTAISGVSFNLPQFEAADFSGMAANLLGNSGREQIFTADAVDARPRPISRAEPQFPTKARQRGITGYVKLNILIGTTGAVEKVKVLEAQPQGIFEEPALAAVQAWRFDPPRYQGEAVRMWFQQTLKFELN
jgi:periplasmic protein TonB